MSFLIVFLIIWVVAPGPIAALTLNRSRSQGFAAGLAVAAGATITTVVIFFVVVFVTVRNISIVPTSTSSLPQVLGALLIIILGLHTGYKAHLSSSPASHAKPTKAQKPNELHKGNQRRNCVQGAMVALTGIPQAIIFYIILVPQMVAADQHQSMIIAFGLGKIALTLVWYTAVAWMVSYLHTWLRNPKVSQRFDFATAILMVGFGINILV